jgi:serine/threonine protein kinase
VWHEQTVRPGATKSPLNANRPNKEISWKDLRRFLGRSWQHAERGPPPATAIIRASVQLVPYMTGSTLGHYRIERLLGSGGMGDVYLADDTKLGRRVALKVLSRGLSSDSDRRERFEREARAAAALNHPNIVTIYSVEEVDGVSFLTLELIEGQALVAMIPAGGLALDRILDLAIPLADGVGAAHQRGITHRDLKPANVMIASDGRLKILDFGLTKIKEDLRADESALPTAALTGEGRIVGTVNYMSPEQAEAKAVDQRSDVFSLGVILYQMATGVRPFEGDTQMSTLSSIVRDTPTPIGERRAGLPREFIKIVNRCLAKDPEDRYQAAGVARPEPISSVDAARGPEQDRCALVPNQLRRLSIGRGERKSIPVPVPDHWLLFDTNVAGEESRGLPIEVSRSVGRAYGRRASSSQKPPATPLNLTNSTSRC